MSRPRIPKKVSDTWQPTSWSDYEVRLARWATEDPEHWAHLKRRDEYEAPLRLELLAIGVDVVTVASLPELGLVNPATLAILVKYLDRLAEDHDRHWLVRCFASRAGLRYWRELKELYSHLDPTKDRLTKDGAAAALAEIVRANEDSHVDELAELARDTSNGPSRLHFIPVLTASVVASAREAAADLASDPELLDSQIIALASKRPSDRMVVPKAMFSRKRRKT